MARIPLLACVVLVALGTGCGRTTGESTLGTNASARPKFTPSLAPPSPVEPPAPANVAPSCPPGFADCEGTSAGACATDLDHDGAHCGGCANACAPESTCVAGACRTGVVGVAAGGSHSCAWRADGRALCWGLNGAGQLGVRAGAAHLEPALLEAPQQVVEIAAGRYFACARLRTGEVECWGMGPLGRGSAILAHALPARVSGIDDAIQIVAGKSHACALRRGGAVACWGENVAGQLGRAALGTDHLPKPVVGIEDAIMIAAGGAHSCAVTRARRVRCWGLNRFGELGNGATASPSPHAPREPEEGEVVAAPSPVDVGELADVARISLGAFHSCAVTRAGALYCWGHDDAGQLGVGDRVDRSLPVRVALDGVDDVRAGERHTCARVRGGDVHCWGEGEGGRLGTGTEDDHVTPARVTGIERAIAIGVGDLHGCAVDESGEVHCWGANDGQLGDGTTETRLAPVAAKLPD